MKALVFDTEGLRLDAEYPNPAPMDGEALVRVRTAGICATDIEITRGYMGFRGVLGHEFAGRIEHDTTGRFGRGARVVGEINASCGKCEWCMGGLPTHCPARSVLGIVNRPGAMAEFLTLPTGNLHAIPEGVPDEEAVFTEPLAAALQVMHQVHVRPGSRVLVMGDGRLGLLIALALSQTSPGVMLMGRHEDKLQIARNAGIGTLLDGRDEAGRVFDIVVEATGSASGFPRALTLVKPRGTVVLKSTVAVGEALNLAPIVIDEITVVGSRCGAFGPALDMLRAGRLNVRPLISGVYKFEDATAAFAYARNKGVLKVLLNMT